jgi:hypothetical protein
VKDQCILLAGTPLPMPAKCMDPSLPLRMTVPFAAAALGMTLHLKAVVVYFRSL